MKAAYPSKINWHEAEILLVPGEKNLRLVVHKPPKSKAVEQGPGAREETGDARQSTKPQAAQLSIVLAVNYQAEVDR